MHGLPTGYLAGRRIILAASQASPSAGADFTITVPAGRFWVPCAVRATLTTAVAVANRLPKLAIAVDGATVATIPAAAVVAASLALTVTWSDAGASFTVAGASPASYAVGPLPELILPPGATLASSTDAIQAADQWSGITFLAWEYWTETASGDPATGDPSLVDTLHALGY